MGFITERRYYYDFKCVKCKKHHEGYEVTAFKGGLVIKRFQMYCDYCNAVNEINFTVKYHRIYGN
jgi:ribosomal protein L44E